MPISQDNLSSPNQIHCPFCYGSTIGLLNFRVSVCLSEWWAQGFVYVKQKCYPQFTLAFCRWVSSFFLTPTTLRTETVSSHMASGSWKRTETGPYRDLLCCSWLTSAASWDCRPSLADVSPYTFSLNHFLSGEPLRGRGLKRTKRQNGALFLRFVKIWGLGA